MQPKNMNKTFSLVLGIFVCAALAAAALSAPKTPAGARGAADEDAPVIRPLTD